MKRFSNVIAVVGVFGILGSALAAVEVSPIGLQISQAGYGKNEYGGADLAPFNGQGKASTQIALMLKSDGRKFISLDEQKSKITTAKDDKGGNLLSGKTFMGKPFDFVFPKVSEDGKALLVTVRVPVVPKKGSSKISLKGELQVKTGGETELKKASNLELKNGVKFKIGKQGFTVKEVGKPKFGDAVFEFTLKSDKSFDEIQEFQLLDERGKKVDVKETGSSSSSGFGGRSGTYTKTFESEKKLGKVTVSAKVYTDFKAVKIPVDQVISIGL